MGRIKANTDYSYNTIIMYLDAVVRDMNTIKSINNEIRYYEDFSEGRNLQNFINDCYSISNNINELENSIRTIKKKIETQSNNLTSAANSLPYLEVQKRKGIL